MSNILFSEIPNWKCRLAASGAELCTTWNTKLQMTEFHINAHCKQKYVSLQRKLSMVLQYCMAIRNHSKVTQIQRCTIMYSRKDNFAEFDKSRLKHDVLAGRAEREKFHFSYMQSAYLEHMHWLQQSTQSLIHEIRIFLDIKRVNIPINSAQHYQAQFACSRQTISSFRSILSNPSPFVFCTTFVINTLVSSAVFNSAWPASVLHVMNHSFDTPLLLHYKKYFVTMQ